MAKHNLIPTPSRALRFRLGEVSALFATWDGHLLVSHGDNLTLIDGAGETIIGRWIGGFEAFLPATSMAVAAQESGYIVFCISTKAEQAVMAYQVPGAEPPLIHRIELPDGRPVVAPTQLPQPGADPRGIAVAPDGQAWFVEPSGNRIGRISRNGELSQWSLESKLSAAPTARPAGPSLAGIPALAGMSPGEALRYLGVDLPDDRVEHILADHGHGKNAPQDGAFTGAISDRPRLEALIASALHRAGGLTRYQFGDGRRRQFLTSDFAVGDYLAKDLADARDAEPRPATRKFILVTRPRNADEGPGPANVVVTAYPVP